MSPKFQKVKTYYDRRLWSKKMVHDAVEKEWITEEEFILIVGTEAEE